MLPIYQQDIVIVQGADWQPVMRWLSETMVHKRITAVEIGLPTLLTVTAHGLTGTARIPIWITNVDGPRALNTDGYTGVEPRWATVVDQDTLAVDFDTGGLRAYVAGGVVTWRTPVDLTGWQAAQEIRPSLDSTEVLNRISTDGGGITLGADGTISRHISAADTAALGTITGVYRLDLTDPNGIVTRFAQGAASVCPDFPPTP